jgi:hypothetical protein
MTIADKSTAAAPRGPFFVVPAGTRASECRSRNCRAEVYWIVTDNNRRMPVDCDVPGGSEPTAREPGQGVSHFATCADADNFRRGKG